MGSSLAKEKKIKIADLTPKGRFFYYLRPSGEVIMRKVEDFDVLCFEKRAKDWYSAIVCCGLYRKIKWKTSVFLIELPVAQPLLIDSSYN